MFLIQLVLFLHLPITFVTFVQNLRFRLKGIKMFLLWLLLNLNWAIFNVKSIQIDKFRLNVSNSASF